MKLLTKKQVKELSNNIIEFYNENELKYKNRFLALVKKNYYFNIEILKQGFIEETASDYYPIFQCKKSLPIIANNDIAIHHGVKEGESYYILKNGGFETFDFEDFKILKKYLNEIDFFN